MRGYTSNSSIHLYIISHFLPLCKTFFEKNNFFLKINVFLPFYRKRLKNIKEKKTFEKVFRKNNKNRLTILDICAKILNCIIIAYYAYFCPLLIRYMGKSGINVELRSSLFRFYLYIRVREEQGSV